MCVLPNRLLFIWLTSTLLYHWLIKKRSLGWPCHCLIGLPAVSLYVKLFCWKAIRCSENSLGRIFGIQAATVLCRRHPRFRRWKQILEHKGNFFHNMLSLCDIFEQINFLEKILYTFASTRIDIRYVLNVFYWVLRYSSQKDRSCRKKIKINF